MQLVPGCDTTWKWPGVFLLGAAARLHKDKTGPAGVTICSCSCRRAERPCRQAGLRWGGGERVPDLQLPAIAPLSSAISLTWSSKLNPWARHKPRLQFFTPSEPQLWPPSDFDSCV